jgi:predicted aspartyl protease
MRTRLWQVLFLPILSISIMGGVASGQQPVDPKPATLPKAVDEKGPSATTTPKLADLTPFELAMASYRRKQFAEASMAFNQVGQSGNADSARAFAWLARTELKLEKISEAEVAAQKALALIPTLPTGHSALGEVYFRQGKIPDAEKEFLTPLKGGIPDPRAYLGEARICWITSNQKRAKQLIDKAHALDPQDPDILRWWMSTFHRSVGLTAPKKESQPDIPISTQNQPQSGVLSEDSVGNSAPGQDCRLANSVTSTETQLDRLMLDANRFRGLGLTVKLNGTPSKLLLDTGASGIMINSKLAERAGVRHVSDIKLGGVGDEGAATGYVGYVDHIQVGGLEFKGCNIQVVDRKRSMGEDGFVGPDVFQDFLIDINFPDGKLVLSPLPNPPGAANQSVSLQSEEGEPPPLHDRYIASEMESYERFYRFRHFILVPVLVNKTTIARLFMMDTGAYQTSLSTDLARQVTKVHPDNYTQVRGFNGKVKNVYRADEVTLGFAQSRLMQQPKDIVAWDISDISESAGTEVSGVLGFSLLWLLDIKIDYRDGLVHFSYNPNRIH